MFVQGLCLLLILPCALGTLTDDEIKLLREAGIDVIDKDADTWILEHDGTPDHGHPGGFGNNPNVPSIQNYSFEIPKQAIVAEDKGCVRLGPIGLSLSGAPFYNPYTGQGKNAVEGDCQEQFDLCSGHPSPNGAYHYHKLPACLYTDTLTDKFLGVAFDGYPIYGPMDGTGRNLTSADLDQCHGHEYNGRYVYRITFDFPYILGCYHGDPIEDDTIMGGTGPPGGQGPRPQGRRKRSDLYKHVTRYRRKVPGSNDPCTQVTDPRWQMSTCYAICENPGNGNCDEETTPTSTPRDVNSSPIMNVPALASIMFCCGFYFLFM